jgi:hypothetical protein
MSNEDTDAKAEALVFQRKCFEIAGVVSADEHESTIKQLVEAQAWNRAQMEVNARDMQRAADLEQRLAERDAQLAECIQVLAEYADRNHWGYMDPGGCPKGMGRYTDYCEIGPDTAEEALKKSPTSAKHNAEILRTAEALAATVKNDPIEQIWRIENPTLVALVEAVRAKKAGE